MPQMENTCKLRAKCLKKDEPLDKCNNPECQNVIHPSCFNKILVTFAVEEEWEGPVFCGKRCFNANKKMQEAAENKVKGRVLWHADGPTVGSTVRREIEDFWKRQHLDAGYDVVYTPHIANINLWKTSRHFEFYRDGMFDQRDVENDQYK
jgi:hypothetical protein